MQNYLATLLIKLYRTAFFGPNFLCVISLWLRSTDFCQDSQPAVGIPILDHMDGNP